MVRCLLPVGVYLLAAVTMVITRQTLEVYHKYHFSPLPCGLGARLVYVDSGLGARLVYVDSGLGARLVYVDSGLGMKLVESQTCWDQLVCPDN